jgi:hypothetical protein
MLQKSVSKEIFYSNKKYHIKNYNIIIIHENTLQNESLEKLKTYFQ